jgi:hypothetical protein
MARATPTQQAEIAERREKILIFVRNGLSYREIAPLVGVSFQQVAKDFQAALAEIIRPAAENVRTLMIIRAEWIWERAADVVIDTTNMDQRLRALDRCSVALERLAKLNGVDAPMRTDVVLTNDMIKAEIAELEAKLASEALDPET